MWCMVPKIQDATDSVFFFFSFLAFYPCPNNTENQNFEKMEKIYENITILHMHHKWNHMMHGSWNMERDRQNLLSF